MSARDDLVLLDLDGTLTDSAPGILTSVRHAYGALRLPVPAEPVLRGFVGHAVYPGIPECLTALRGAGLRLAVATSKPEPMAWRIVEHFGLDAHLDRGLDDVFGATLDGTRSTKADVVAHALASLDAARRVVMVGDREHDVLGAAAHRVPCVGVAWGYARPGELAAAGATAVVGTPAGLATVLLRRAPLAA